MNPYIYPSIWNDPDFEPLSAAQKLTVFWLFTNSRVNVLGYAETSPRRFAFETGLELEALAKTFEALPKTFRRDGENAYWVRSYIRRQFGCGLPLLRNNFCRTILRELKASSSPSLALWVLDEYPELKKPFEALGEGEALAKGLGNPTQAQGKDRIGKVRLGKVRTGKAEAHGAEAPAEQIPPDPADVAAYFTSLGSTEAQAALFFDHYEGNGWHQGGGAALHSWRAAARNWVRRSQDGGDFGSKNSSVVVPPPAPLPPGVGGVIVPDEEPAPASPASEGAVPDAGARRKGGKRR